LGGMAVSFGVFKRDRSRMCHVPYTCTGPFISTRRNVFLISPNKKNLPHVVVTMCTTHENSCLFQYFWKLLSSGI
jgi:hypothetical protein